MKNLKKCPKRGCDILIPPGRMRCTKHWNELPSRVRVAWMRRNQVGADNDFRS